MISGLHIIKRSECCIHIYPSICHTICFKRNIISKLSIVVMNDFRINRLFQQYSVISPWPVHRAVYFRFLLHHYSKQHKFIATDCLHTGTVSPLVKDKWRINSIILSHCDRLTKPCVSSCTTTQHNILPKCHVESGVKLQTNKQTNPKCLTSLALKLSVHWW